MRLLEANQQTRENTSLLVAENHSNIVQDLLIYIYTNLSFPMSKTQQYLQIFSKLELVRSLQNVNLFFKRA